MSAYVVFTPYPYAGLDNRPFDIGQFMAAVCHQGLFRGRVPDESHAPRSGKTVYDLPPLNPAAASVLYTFPRLQPTALAISVAPFPCFLKATIFAMVEGRRAALVDALCLRSLDACTLPLLQERQLHLSDHAEDGQDHLAHWSAGVDCGLKDAEVCALLLKLMYEVQNVAGGASQPVELGDNQRVARVYEVHEGLKLAAALARPPWVEKPRLSPARELAEESILT
jgi:hypothetical protein